MGSLYGLDELSMRLIELIRLSGIIDYVRLTSSYLIKHSSTLAMTFSGRNTLKHEESLLEPGPYQAVFSVFVVACWFM